VSVASSSQASFFAAHLTRHSFFYWPWLLGDLKASFPTEIPIFSAFLSFSPSSRSILDRFFLQSTLLTRTVTQLLHERILVPANVTRTERENVLSTFSSTPSHSISFPHPHTQEHPAIRAETESFRRSHADLDHISEYLTPSRAYTHHQ
jgi:hypothetical protein